MKKRFKVITITAIAALTATLQTAHAFQVTPPVFAEERTGNRTGRNELLVAENSDLVDSVVEQVRRALINGGRVAAVKATLLGAQGLPPNQGIRSTAIRLSFTLISNEAEGWNFKELDDNFKLRTCGKSDDWDVWIGNDRWAAVSPDARVLSGHIPLIGPRKCYWRE